MFAQCWQEPFLYDGDEVLVDSRRLPALTDADQDEDYLSDSFEYAIARHYRPYLNCHESDENCYSYEDHVEPLVLYQVSAWDFGVCAPFYLSNIEPVIPEMGIDSGKIYIYVKYAFLWTVDEGVGPCPYSDDGLPCGDGGVPCGGFAGWYGHYGDNQTFTLFFEADRSDLGIWTLLGIENDSTSQRQRVESGRFGACSVEYLPAEGDPDPGCHVNIYFSMWKHHQYVEPGRHCADDCSGDWFHGTANQTCCETIDADDQVRFLPDIGFDPSVPYRRHHNPGSQRHHMLDSLSIFVPDWTDESSSSAWGERMFCADREVRNVYVPSAAKYDDRCCIQGCEGPDADCCDLCLSGPRANERLWYPLSDDADNDCLMDDEDPCPLVNLWADPFWDYGGVMNGDVDGDGFGYSCDNCPEEGYHNPDQADSDGDGYGDVCDKCPQDPLIGGIPDVTNPEELDDDGDGSANMCDGCPHDASRAPLLRPSSDRDGDGLANECDLCPRDDPRYDDPENIMDDDTYSTVEIDDISLSGDAQDSLLDNDGIGRRCDNCPSSWNPDQANCNYQYEIRSDLVVLYQAVLGDVCDPDPCVSLCDESDMLSDKGQCSFQASDSIITSSSHMYGGYTTGSGEAFLDHYDVAWNPRGGATYEAQQVYYCTCWNPVDEKYYSDDECINEGVCVVNGDPTPDLDRYTGWFETIRSDALVMVDEDTAMAPCSPTLSPGETDPRTCEIHGSDPDRSYPYGPPPRSLSIPPGETSAVRTDAILWGDGWGAPYPPASLMGRNIPGGIETYRMLKFWIRPLDNSSLDEDEEGIYQPPMYSYRVLPDPEHPDWNNLYTSLQKVRDVNLRWGSDIFSGFWDGRLLGKIQGWLEDGPPEAKNKIVIPDLWYKINGHCPPGWESLCFFDVTSPGSALLGITFVEFDAHQRLFTRLIPSRAVQGETPGERGMAMTLLPGTSPEDEAVVVAFGGENDLGKLSSATWMAVIGEEPGEAGVAYYWQRIGTVAGSPPARKDSAMFTDPGSGKIFLFGGEDAGGVLGDLWELSASETPHAFSTEGAVAPYWEWKKIHPLGQVPSPRSGMAVSVDGEAAGIYGGTGPAGQLGDLYRYNFEQGRFDLLVQSGPAPGSRANASVEYDASREKVYLFGGSEGEGLHNDLWELDTRTGTWTRLIEDCASGTCPLPAEESLLVRDAFNGRLTLLPGRLTANREMYYAPAECGWVGQGQIEGTPKAADCDGDGLPDPGVGILCPSGDQWWSVPGVMACDSFTGATSCSGGAASGEEIGRIHAPGATAFDVQGSLVWVARDSRLECHDASAPSSPAHVSTLLLPCRTRDIRAEGGRVFLACDGNVLIVDASDPALPFVAAEVPTCGRAMSLALDRNVLAVASSGGVGLVDVSSMSNPEGLGMLWIREAGPHLWAEEGSMEACALMGEGERFWTDRLGFFSGSARIIESDAGFFYAASRKTVLSLYVETGRRPVFLDSLRLSRPIDEMRALGGRNYVNLEGGAKVTVDAADPTNLFIDAPHEVFWWVEGQEISGDLVYLLDHNEIMIARVSPGGGRAW
jgi:hypothetical protein